MTEMTTSTMKASSSSSPEFTNNEDTQKQGQSFRTFKDKMIAFAAICETLVLAILLCVYVICVYLIFKQIIKGFVLVSGSVLKIINYLEISSLWCNQCFFYWTMAIAALLLLIIPIL